MRHRDQPTVEVTQRVRCDVSAAWALVTDIGLPVRCSPELQAAQWIGDADGVTLGARFRGRNRLDEIGEWETECEVVEVEHERRWVWNVTSPEGVIATWAFEVDPVRDGVVIRQWARLGTAPSGMSAAIAARPDREGRTIAERLSDWQQNMQLNLDYIRAHFERPAHGS